MRVGGEKDIAVDVRIIAATNKDLMEEIGKGTFREDLYHRISVILINVPELKERKDDIPLIAEHFLKVICENEGKPQMQFTSEALEELKTYPWTGNVRELRNVVERMAILCDQVITLDDVRLYAQPLQQMKQ